MASRRTAAPHLRRLRTVVVVALVAAGLPLLPARIGPVQAQELPPVFGPVASTAFGGSSAFGRVVADGAGAFHSVVREDGLSQSVVHRISRDGGLTWVPTGRFAGEDGGATRPRVAVDGDRVAVTFVGSWCQSPSLCPEAPYLVSSSDAGRSWSAPRRLAGTGFEVDVAVAGDRTWVAWDDSTGRVRLRGTQDGGGTWFAALDERGDSPSLAASGDTVVAAWADFLRPRGTTARGAVLAAPVTLATGDARVLGVAAADGRGHVLLGTDTALQVVSADAPGPFEPPVAVGARGRSADLAARRGLVAVAVATDDGVTAVRASRDGGRSFSAPAAVSVTPGGEPLVQLTTARLTSVRPTARFDWSVPSRYFDRDGDGLADPANVGEPLSLGDGARVQRATVDVRLQACGAALPAPGRSIASYAWTADGVPLDGQGCSVVLPVASGAKVRVRLEVTDDAGQTASTSQVVAPRDFVVVSLGDSVASGEGSPHVNGRVKPLMFERWQDDACHRSAYAGPALAAKAVEDTDPRSSVTFVQLACSGAAVIDTATVPGRPDDPDTGGILDTYRGVEPALLAPARPSQLTQLTALLGGRSVDALTISAGANDVRFSDVVKGCLVSPVGDTRPCHTSSVAQGFEQRLAGLPARYSQLAGALDGLSVAPGKVLLTQYYGLSSDDADQANLRCIADTETIGTASSVVAELAGAFSAGGVGGVYAELVGFVSGLVNTATNGGIVTDDESAWVRDRMVPAINGAVSAAASTHGWGVVGGLVESFSRHGYCSSDPWVVRLGASLDTQLDQFGSFHPNRAGQAAYGRALAARLRPALGAVPATREGDDAGASLAGDLYVITASRTHVVAASALDTGGVPLPVAARRLDRLVSGNGYVGPAGPPAADAATGVGLWTQVGNVDGARPRVRASRLALSPNAAIRQVTVVQAPADGTRLTADRDTVVQAVVEADLPEPEVLDVTTEAFDSEGTLTTVTEQIRLVPGRNTLLLPRRGFLRPVEGRAVAATVTVSDPSGTGPDRESDNSSTSPTAGVVATRPLSVLFLPADTGAGSVGCPVVAQAAGRMGRYASTALPVSGDRVVADVACTALSGIPPDEPGLLRALSALDRVARLSGRDLVVAVVPSGWLQAAAGGAVGVAATGLRASIVEAGAPSQVLPHEYAHVVGVNHTPALVRASGVSLPDRGTPSGVDWMAPIATNRTWTGGASWEQLLDRIGGPAAAPAPPDPAAAALWVSGTLDLAGGLLGVAPFVPAGPDTRPVDGELGVERLEVRQLDGAGALLATTSMPLGEAGTLLTAGTTGDGKVGRSFGALVELDPRSATIELMRGGLPLLRRAVAPAPVVALTAPAAGTRLSRGQDLTVAWTAIGAGELTADVLVSQDDGRTYAPLAVGVTGTRTTLPVPAQLNGTVRVRVVVSNGVRQGQADSAPLDVNGGGLTVSTPRVVFDRGTDFGSSDRLLTADLDGTDVRPVVLPTRNTALRSGQVVDCSLVNDECTPSYEGATWTPDGSRLVFSSTLKDGRFPVDEFGSSDDIREHLWSSAPDGSDLRRVTAPGRNGTRDGRVVSEYNRCPDASATGRLAWLGAGNFQSSQRYATGVRTAALDGAGEALVAPRVASWPSSVLVAPGWPQTPNGIRINVVAPSFGNDQKSCPTWSPDGTRLVFFARVVVVAPPGGSDESFPAIVTVAADGSNLRVVTSPDPSFSTSLCGNCGPQSIDWLDAGRLVFSWLTLDGRTARQGLDRLDLATGVRTPLRAPDTVAPTVAPVLQTVRTGLPDGDLVASSYEFRDGRNVNRFGLIDPLSGELRLVDLNDGGGQDRGHALGVPPAAGGGPVVPAIVTPPAPTPAPADGGGPYDARVDELVTLDAGRSALLADPTAAVAWDLDGDGEYDDVAGATPDVSFATAGDARIAVRISAGSAVATGGATVSVADPELPAATLAPGAADPVTRRVPQDVAMTVPDGRTTPVPLSSDGVRLIVTDLPTTVRATDTLGGGRSVDGSVSTLTDGVLLVTPALGTPGLAEAVIRVAGLPGAAALRLTVTANRSPAPAPDRVVAVAGRPLTLLGAALLANDTDPDGGALRLTGVVGGTEALEAWLDLEDRVQLRPSAPGAVTLTYMVRDPDGGVATAPLTVEVLAAEPPTPEPPTPEPPTPGTPTPGTRTPGTPSSHGEPTPGVPTPGVPTPGTQTSSTPTSNGATTPGATTPGATTPGATTGTPTTSTPTTGTPTTSSPTTGTPTSSGGTTSDGGGPALPPSGGDPGTRPAADADPRTSEPSLPSVEPAPTTLSAPPPVARPLPTGAPLEPDPERTDAAGDTATGLSLIRAFGLSAAAVLLLTLVLLLAVRRRRRDDQVVDQAP